MEAFQKDVASFERFGTQVLGVSPDDVETHKRFAASLGLTFPLNILLGIPLYIAVAHRVLGG